MWWMPLEIQEIYLIFIYFTLKVLVNWLIYSFCKKTNSRSAIQNFVQSLTNNNILRPLMCLLIS